MREINLDIIAIVGASGVDPTCGVNEIVAALVLTAMRSIPACGVNINSSGAQFLVTGRIPAACGGKQSVAVVAGRYNRVDPRMRGKLLVRARI